MCDLTLEEAFKCHHGMWKWIADRIWFCGKVLCILDEKQHYIECVLCCERDKYLPHAYCFLCAVFNDCISCHKTLGLKYKEDRCLGGLYEQCFYATDFKTQYSLAMKIANLTVNR